MQILPGFGLSQAWQDLLSSELTTMQTSHSQVAAGLLNCEPQLEVDFAAIPEELEKHSKINFMNIEKEHTYLLILLLSMESMNSSINGHNTRKMIELLVLVRILRQSITGDKRTLVLHKGLWV